MEVPTCPTTRPVRPSAPKGASRRCALAILEIVEASAPTFSLDKALGTAPRFLLDDSKPVSELEAHRFFENVSRLYAGQFDPELGRETFRVGIEFLRWAERIGRSL